MRPQILLRAVAISLIGLAVAACNTARPVTADPVLTVPVRHYPAERQRLLANEIASAPAGVIWPDFIADYSTLRRSACAVTPRQHACRQICAAEGNRLAFCARTN